MTNRVRADVLLACYDQQHLTLYPCITFTHEGGVTMKLRPADLQRERYDFSEGMLRLVNWREVEPDPPGRWPGIYGDPETELIICRETMGSKQTVIFLRIGQTTPAIRIIMR